MKQELEYSPKLFRIAFWDCSNDFIGNRHVVTCSRMAVAKLIYILGKRVYSEGLRIPFHQIISETLENEIIAGEYDRKIYKILS